MQVNNLIARLEQLLEQVGDVDIEVRNPAGEYDIADGVEVVNVARERGMVTWRVFIDTSA